MTRRAAAVATLVLAVVALAACGVPDDGLHAIGRDELPSGLRDSSTTTEPPTTDVPSASDVSVYWIREDRLVPEVVSFQSVPSVLRVLSLLERGPTAELSAFGLRSVISQENLITGAERRGDEVVVDLSDAFSQVTGSDQALAVGQIVASVTSIPGVDKVTFRQSGELVDVPVADGSLVRRPLTRQDFADVLVPPG